MNLENNDKILDTTTVRGFAEGLRRKRIKDTKELDNLAKLVNATKKTDNDSIKVCAQFNPNEGSVDPDINKLD